MSIVLEDEIADRAQGALFGQVCGDALGTRYEFSSSEDATNDVKKDLYCGHLCILGGGPFGLVSGQVTDDSELALGQSCSLVREGQFDICSIAQNYAIWFRSNPFDIGMTTNNAFRGTSPDFNPQTNYNIIMKNSQTSRSRASLSNGCLMRTSPLAIAGTYWSLDSLQKASDLDCQLTNPNPIAIDAARVYVTAIRTAILTGDRLETYRTALKSAQTATITDILKMVKPKTPHFPTIYLSDGTKTTTDGPYQGYLGVALQNAFYELLHGTDIENSLVHIIERGGDTDTNACIAGSLLGALYGYQKIPPDWSNSVTNLYCPSRLSAYPLVDCSQLAQTALDLLKVRQPIFK
jgi:ADP-ribosyl-[dinitrogen reductase] hydrolase